MRLLIVILFSLAGIVACSTHDYNATVFDYHYQPTLASKGKIKKIMIAPTNYNTPSRHYLRVHENATDQLVSRYLQDSGYKILPARSFETIWKHKQYEHGDMYDLSTGKMSDIYLSVRKDAINEVFEQNPTLDAILFTDLVEQPLTFSKPSQKTAEWDGVRRRLKVERLAYGEQSESTEEKHVDGISIVTYLVDRTGEVVFHSRGGIQIAQSIELNNKQESLQRRKDLLKDEDEILEGIQLSLHPFIPMADYPGRKP